jgi:hypothetical protein
MTTILNILDDVIGKAERKENETNEWYISVVFKI